MTDILPADLARLVGVPASTITRVESGERQPGEPLVQKLATVFAPLGVTPAWLRYGEGVEPAATAIDTSELRYLTDEEIQRAQLKVAEATPTSSPAGKASRKRPA